MIRTETDEEDDMEASYLLLREYHIEGDSFYVDRAFVLCEIIDPTRWSKARRWYVSNLDDELPLPNNWTF